jgi:hypothetical protein
MASMKAAYIDRFGGPEVLQYGDLPDPVAISAASWCSSCGDDCLMAVVRPPLIA